MTAKDASARRESQLHRDQDVRDVVAVRLGNKRLEAMPLAMRCAAEKLPSDANASIDPLRLHGDAVVFAVVATVLACLGFHLRSLPKVEVRFAQRPVGQRHGLRLLIATGPLVRLAALGQFGE
jgi:hypothetical protein